MSIDEILSDHLLFFFDTKRDSRSGLATLALGYGAGAASRLVVSPGSASRQVA